MSDSWVCGICKKPLDIPNEPISRDCGGDCWGCVSEIEAEGLGAPLDEYRGNPPTYSPWLRDLVGTGDGSEG